jgi:FkbM family methyltransferase
MFAAPLMLTLRQAVLRVVTLGRGVPRVVNGLPLRVDIVGRHTFTPVYDAGATAYLRDRVREGDEVWNVGANVGVYALQLAHWVGPAGKVVAFEPNPIARAVLARNGRFNGLERRIEIVAAAVGAAPDTVEFFISGTDGMGRAGLPNPRLRDPRRITVPVIALDALARERRTTPAFVVMDIEGWEIAALQGARMLLATTPFVMELHPNAWQWSGHRRADLEAIISGERLTLVPLSGQADPLEDYGQVVLEPPGAGPSVLARGPGEW